MEASHDLTPNEILLADLRRMPWVKGIGDEAIEEIVEVSETMQVSEGEVIHRAGETLTAVYFVMRGRLWASVVDLFGKTVLERPLVRGGCFGLFSVAQPDQATVNVTSMEPTTLLKVGFDQIPRLTSKYPDLQMNLYRMAGNQVRQIVMADRTREQPSAVAIVHHSDATRVFTKKLIQRMAQIEDSICVAGDHPNWEPIEGVEYRAMVEDGKVVSPEERTKVLKQWSQRGRIFVDLSADLGFDDLAHTMTFAETVLWCVRPEDVAKAEDVLRKLEDRVAGWRDKICLVWLLKTEDYVAPYAPELTSLVDRTYKLTFEKPVTNQGNVLAAGLERIVHYLRGIRIGIALGGGAARGMAHLGVLKTLEQHGIYIDMFAGTSAGAMSGTLYTYGMEVDYNIRSYMKDLRLPWIYRKIPAGGYWYLLHKYRRGLFDPMLRKYIGNARLEQLPIPTYTVTVDLVRGGPVVREEGDAVKSILESINIPGLSRPILGETEALVDGGLVNNIPADVLVAKGCNFVIASSVTAKLETHFSGISHNKDSSPNPSKKRRKPSTMQVLLRGYLVQSCNMNAVGVEPADFVIAPDVTGFDASEFERTDEMAAIGAETTLEAIAGIKQLLSKLDSRLFPE